MTVPYWLRTTTPQTLEADVAIVGGGVCGLSAALHARKRGLRAVVLERHVPGAGASTRNAGFLMRGLAENYRCACDTFGKTIARDVWRWSEANLEGLRSLGIESLSSFRSTPSCLLALEQGEADDLAESAAMLQADGFGVLLAESGADSVWQSGLPLIGLVNPGDATVNPGELVGHLASLLGDAVFQSQEVFGIEPAQAGEHGRCTVRTAGVNVHASHVLVCTNAHAGTLVPQLASLVQPNRGQMLALSASGARLDYAYYVNHGHEYIRQDVDGTIVVGGCRKQFADAEQSEDDRTTGQVQEAIEAFGRLILDRPIRVLARWAGTMGFSPDGMPLVGPISSDGSVWFCGGFTGHGMSLAYRTSAGAVAAMLDGPNADPLAETFAMSRLAEWSMSSDARIV